MGEEREDAIVGKLHYKINGNAQKYIMRCNVHQVLLSSHIIDTMPLLGRAMKRDTNNNINSFFELLLICIAIHQVILVIFAYGTLVVMVHYETILDPSI